MSKADVVWSFPRISRPLVFLWAVLVLGAAAFLIFGSLRIGAGSRIGRRMPVREIWSRFLGYLADHGASSALLIAVSGAAVVALIAAAIALWLAFALEDKHPDPPADESAGM
jgi:hypothetical protein